MRTLPVFFLRAIQRINEGFPSLLSPTGDSEGGNGGGGDEVFERFTKRFGWISTAERVAEVERIELNKVWELPTVQFLNDILYIREKDKYLNAINSKSTGSSTIGTGRNR